MSRVRCSSTRSRCGCLRLPRQLGPAQARVRYRGQTSSRAGSHPQDGFKARALAWDGAWRDRLQARQPRAAGIMLHPTV